MAGPEEINADMLAFWNGKGGHTWVARQEHTDITLTPVTDALLGFAPPRAGERVVDIGCGFGAPTLEFARGVGPSGRVVGFDISGPMLAEGERRVRAAGLANVDWRQVDPATAALDEYDLLAFQMVEVAIPRQMFQEILRLIAELRPHPPPAPA
jgi:ubiquinone/menaquinone biosynthesis C-methylase UbiE